MRSAWLVCLLLVAGCAVSRGVPLYDASTDQLDFSSGQLDGLIDGPKIDMARPRDFSEGPDLSDACANTAIVINELKTGGSSGTDEFIELYNPCGGSVDLTSYKVVYRSAAGTSDVTVATLALPIGPLGYLLLANSGYAGPIVDVPYTAGLSATGGGVALKDPAGNVVDSVGWGSATNAFVEGGTAAPAPPQYQSIARVPNANDTDVNSTDFQVAGATTPRAAN